MEKNILLNLKMEAKAPLKVIGKSKYSGTQITFLPSKEIFHLLNLVAIFL